jgi:hypothetical protein
MNDHATTVYIQGIKVKGPYHFFLFMDIYDGVHDAISGLGFCNRWLGLSEEKT